LHLGTKSLLKFFDQHRNDESLVLVTITSTVGSTYRKPGAMMLISRDNAYEGMISGGCLEPDLLHHAQEVFETGKPKTVTYDMHADDELVWSLGLGCDGIIHLFLQRLDRKDGFSLLDFIQNSLQKQQAVLLGLVIKSEGPGLAIGCSAAISVGGQTYGSDALMEVCAEQSKSEWPQWRQRLIAQENEVVMVVNILPPPRILLCGAGPDALPVVQQVCQLGWECVIVDHRQSFVRQDRFPAGCEVVLSRPEKLQENVQLSNIDAAVIMSHHLDNDAAYLRQLSEPGSAARLRYLGVLGPTSRRDRLREMADCQDDLIYGPVGLDIGAELPESIALAIVSEIHATLNSRDGQSLTTGPVGGSVCGSV
jgi:xanthine dehydrogenase accessory factor